MTHWRVVVLPSLPPLPLVGPDGDRLVLRSLTNIDTVGALAAQLGTDELWTGGRALRSGDRLADVDELRVGVRLLAAPTTCPDEQSNGPGSAGGASPVVEVAITTGPGVTTWRGLAPGRHVVGRARHATMHVDDPSIEPHHAVLVVRDDAEMEIAQLTGSIPIRVDGLVVDASGPLRCGSTILIGSSTLEVRAVQSASRDTCPLGEALRATVTAGSVAKHPNDPWRRVVWRAPFAASRWTETTIAAPGAPQVPRRPAFTSLIGTGVAATGAVAIALVMDNLMFLMFAAMGVLATLATFLVGVGSARRARRRAERAHATATIAFRHAVVDLRSRRTAFHTATHRTMLETMHEVMDGGTQLWQRRLGSDGALVATVGRGMHRWAPSIDVNDVIGGLDPTLLHEIDRCANLANLAAPITLCPGDNVAISGPRLVASSLARAIVIQLSTWVGPADWQLVVVTDEPTLWHWADWLPHRALDDACVIIAGSESSAEFGARLDAIDRARRTLLVTDQPHLFTSRTGPFRRFLGSSNAASIVIVDRDATVPAMCRRILEVGSTGVASWSGDIPESDDNTAIDIAGISVATADELARALTCLVDPEDDGGVGGGVPATVSFAELCGHAAMTPEAIVRRWRAGGRDPAPAAPLGLSVDGRVDVDLVRDGPHGLIAGTTGAGKSELLRTLVLSLAASVAPEHLNFVLVDYKGGSTFDACTELPHTVGLVTDLDEGLAERALVSLDAELHRRERMLRAVGASDLTDYRSHRVPDGRDLEPIARLVVVIDEFAALAKELPEFLSALVGIAQRGRSLGVHLLLATQRPAGVVSDDIRANTNLRLALRLHDRRDAVDVVGNELPATFPRGLPGRAALRLGPDELVVFQAARCTGPVAVEAVGMSVERSQRRSPDAGDGRCGPERDEESELDATVRAIVTAAATIGASASHRPWVEPLPFPLTIADLHREFDVAAGRLTAIGMIDDPAHQCRRRLAWEPGDGSLALIGSIGSGTTSTLVALATAACEASTPDELHLYVIDARGDDELSALESLDHCGGVVKVTDDERVHRMLARVVEVIDQRMSGKVAHTAHVVLMVDGFASLRHGLGAVERVATYDLLTRIVNDGAAVGIALVVADDAGSTLATANRWLFHLDDPSAARGLGLRAPPVPDGMPGRFRVLTTGLEGQVARRGERLGSATIRDGCGSGPALISALPERVEIDALEPRSSTARHHANRNELLIGVSADDLRATSVEVAAGDHVLVIGGPRSGVSTALERCAEAWVSNALADGVRHVVVCLDRRSTPVRSSSLLAALADSAHHVVVVVDDGHRVDDDGTLAKIAQGEYPHATLLAGARADGVRSAYGHWTREVAKSRCGVVMSSRGDPDGDLLGVQLPRRALIPARAGLGWIVDSGPLRQVQVATAASASGAIEHVN